MYILFWQRSARSLWARVRRSMPEGWCHKALWMVDGFYCRTAISVSTLCQRWWTPWLRQNISMMNSVCGWPQKFTSNSQSVFSRYVPLCPVYFSFTEHQDFFKHNIWTSHSCVRNYFKMKEIYKPHIDVYNFALCWSLKVVWKFVSEGYLGVNQ